MGSLSRSGAAMLALIAAVPTFLVVSFLTWQMLLYVNSAATLTMAQEFLAFFSGFAFGLAVFSFVYAARLQVE